MTANKKALCVMGGLLGGFVNGLIGGGGGVVVVLLLTKLYGLSAKKAQATALLVILPLTVLSAIVYIGKGVDWALVGVTSLGFTLGGIAGALLLNRLASDTVRKIFALLLIAGGLRMLFF